MKRENKGLRGKMKGTQPRRKIERSRVKKKVQVVPTRTMKGAHSAKGKCMRVRRTCVWEDIEDYVG